jgi:predicted Zn-dependent peptidase
MRLSKIRIFLGIILLFSATFMAAGQDLPIIGQSSSIKVGILPNEVSYYLAPNNTSKGYANFVLVQKGNANIDRSRDLLLNLPHFQKKSPYEFLASKGVGYGPEGYISYRGDNTVFTFPDVPTFDSDATDSTILLIFDLIQAYKGEQAIIVSGDFIETRLEGELRIFALTVTPREKTPAKEEYVWAPSESLRSLHTENNTRNLATLSCIWNAPRTPRHLLNTPLPAVTYMYARGLQHIVEKRIRTRFFQEDLPIAGVSSRYYSSAFSSGDERHEFSVSVGMEDLEMAVISLASIFAELDTKGAYLEEFQDAKIAIITSAGKAIATPVSNSFLAEECVSSFLYGTNLASTEELSAFFERRQIPPERELSLFNSFAFALFDPHKALEIRFDTPAGPIDKNALISTFHAAWDIAASSPVQPEIYRKSYGDTLSLLLPKKKGKVSVKSTAKDPVTGGSIWTFSNGARVIFKKTNQKGMLNYGLLLKGGYSYVPDIGPGESSFVGDVMGLFRISGMSALDFHNMLDANGIEMHGSASLTDMKVLGTAPSDKLELLLKVLLSYSRDRRPDKEAFAYYKECEKLRQERTRLSRDGIIAAIDSTMCPDYYYPATKSIEKLRDDLPERVDSYLDSQFAKFSDGLLVIVGDVSEEKLKRVLGRYLENFTVSSAFSIRPKVEYNLRPGWSTYTVEASQSRIGSGEMSVNMGMATRQPFTIRSYNAFMIASVAMKNAITEAIAPLGMHAEVNVSVQVFPAERLAFYVTCRPCSVEGLPAGIIPAKPMIVLRALRRGISKVSHGTLSQSELEGLKSTLRNGMATKVSQPAFLISAVMMRNSECKDIVSNYQSAINAVTLADVNAVLHDLDFGSKVEYVIR